jgi:hypothetical protein
MLSLLLIISIRISGPLSFMVASVGGVWAAAWGLLTEASDLRGLGTEIPTASIPLPSSLGVALNSMVFKAVIMAEATSIPVATSISGLEISGAPPAGVERMLEGIMAMEAMMATPTRLTGERKSGLALNVFAALR